MNFQSIAICVLFYNKVDQTIACIESFLSAGVPIYVLNNASHSDARQELDAFIKPYHHVKVFDSPSNLGVGLGRNYLISRTSEDWLFFVDNDIVVETPNWLPLLRSVQCPSSVEVLIPEMFNVHDNAYALHCNVKLHWGVADFSFMPSSQDFTNMFPGGAAICSRELFTRLGGYDEQIFVGFEDVELAIRAYKRGKEICAMTVPSIKLVHDHQVFNDPVNLETVKIRYDLDKIAASENRIKDKLVIIINNNWRFWAKEQVFFHTVQSQLNISHYLVRFFSSVRHRARILWHKFKFYG